MIGPREADVEAASSAPREATLSVLELLDAAAQRNGTVHFVPTDVETTWSALWRDAHRCAGWIRRAMPGHQALAGVLEPTRPCLVALVGSWLAGRTFASLPRRSRGMGVDEYRRHIKALVELAGADVVAAPPDLRATLDGLANLDYADFGRGSTASGADGGALVQFTSGSTDRPRGVVLDMTQIGVNVRAMARSVQVREGDVFFSWLPLSHDMGLMGMCLAPLAAMSTELGGASQLWLSDPSQFMRHPSGWLRLGSAVGGTVTAAPSTALDLVARRRQSRSRDLDLSSLRCLIVGAETVSAATLRRFVAVTSQYGFPEGAVCPAYGLAEATLAVSIVRPGSGWKVLPEGARASGDAPETTELVALGPPVPDMCVRTRPNEEGGQEIEISGASIAREFLGRPASRAADGWLRTGDLGLLWDGELYFTGRTADRVVVAGRNVDAADLSRRLSALPEVRGGCCTVMPERPDGFAIAFEAKGSPGAGEMRALCRSVSDFAVRQVGARPARVLIVGRGEMPRTPSGKLQPHQLRARLADGGIVPLAEVVARRGDVEPGPPPVRGPRGDHGG